MSIQPRVLLVSMPFVSCERPALGLSLLQAQLRRRKTHCDIRYLTFALVDSIGADAYSWVSSDLPYTAFVGDWLFARSLYGADAEADRAYIREILVREWALKREDVERIFRLRASCETFIEQCVASSMWEQYDIIGFSSTFTQNLASLALAKRLKQAHPGLRIVFGGANWEGEMGEALHRCFPFVDFACCGESEESFPALLDAIADGGSKQTLAAIPGIVYRDGDQTLATGAPKLITDMESLPRVRFDDYYRDYADCGHAGSIAPRPLLETSRGCWWGAKSHCTFCGLNGETMAFRSKSPERAWSEIKELVERCGSSYMEVVDNILDMRYFKTLLPRLRDEGPRVRLFYEVKANLSMEQVRLLRDSGVHTIQPGVESFSDHVLQLMGKGVTGLQNVQLLKWCKEFDIRVEWNLLYGFPGETPEDYAEMLKLMEDIRFLGAPSGSGPVRLDRFSPYHVRAESYGMTNVRPIRAYRHLYPNVSDEELMRITYYFDYDTPHHPSPAAYVGPVLDAVSRWQSDEDRGDLWVFEKAAESILVWDDRKNRPHRKLRIEGWKARIYLAADSVRSRQSLHKIAGDDTTAEQADQFLRVMTKVGLMAQSGERFLSLAVHRPRRERKHEPTAEAAAWQAPQAGAELAASRAQ